MQRFSAQQSESLVLCRLLLETKPLYATIEYVWRISQLYGGSPTNIAAHKRESFHETRFAFFKYDYLLTGTVLF